ESRWAKEPGVALNGVKFDPETAERVVCETGEVYRIEAIQELYDLGLDDNNAHVQPTGAYHYHGVPQGLIESLPGTEDVVLVGFASDGFPMYYSRSGRYKPSFRLADDFRTGDACNYRNPHTNETKHLAGSSADGTFVSDWVYDSSLGDLDECNGITLDGQYAYFVTDEYPYVGRCLKGEFTQRGPRGGGPPPGRHGHPHRH
ncbi:MAG: YHYH protein, partial [Bacteroidota bacterium]